MAKLMVCKTCGAQIATTAKACPSCGAKNKKPVYKKWWFWTIIAILLIIIFSPKGNDRGNPASTSGMPTPQKDTFGVGEATTLNDIVVILKGVDENAGKDYNKPEDGKVFVLCAFEIENNSSKDISISSLMSFDAYVDDYSTNMSLSAQMTSDLGQLDGSVASGKKMSGAIGYEVPADWKVIEISFTPDFWRGKDIKFIVENTK
jgi:hypothetical protein